MVVHAMNTQWSRESRSKTILNMPNPDPIQIGRSGWDLGSAVVDATIGQLPMFEGGGAPSGLAMEIPYQMPLDDICADLLCGPISYGAG